MRVTAWLRWASLLAGPLFAGVAAAAMPQDVVVMVETRLPTGGQRGAGLVVSQTDTRTVIVTARHVVADERGRLAHDISIEMHPRRGRLYRVSLHPDYTDLGLDLAVLFLDHGDARDLPRVLTGDRARLLSPTKPDKLAQTAVRVIGAIDRQRWAHGLGNDVVRRWDSELLRLRVRSDTSAVGASGGGLFDPLGRLLGMNSARETGTGDLLVVPMSTIVQQLRRWGIEVGLTEAAAATAPAEIQTQVREGLAIDLRFLEPKHEPGVWPFPGDYVFAYRITARLSRALTEWSPTVEVRFPENVSVPPIRLQPPNHTAEVQLHAVDWAAQAWVTLSDGREVGPLPVRLDALSGPRATAKRLGDWATLHVDKSAHRLQEKDRVERENRSRAAGLKTDYEGQKAKVFEQEMRERLPREFPVWRARCTLRLAWECESTAFRRSYTHRFDSVVHSLALGATPDDLHINMLLDGSADLRTEFPRQVAALLSSGHTEVHVRMRLVSGEQFGPRLLCRVQHVGREVAAVCR